jgi:hypothetical protein
MLSVSLGGVNPRPSTCLGTITNAAALAVILVRKLRRDISFFWLICFFPLSPPTLSRAQRFLRVGIFGPVDSVVATLSSWAGGSQLVKST